ncbi:MAG: IS66 family transposase [Sulfurovum sp.]|nr:IS66 family transposase [Sulfurovum sp.]
MKIELINIEKLQETIINQAQENSTQEKRIQIQQIEINYLKEKIDYLIRQQFTSKSEKLNSTQPSLFEDNAESIEVVEDEEIEITFKRKKGGRTSPPKELPRVRVEHDIGDEEKVCSCGDTMHRVKEIISEQYDIVPAKFQVIENVRFVYGCRCGEKPVTTALAPFILPKTQVTASFLATIAVQKFEDALPLYRQAKIFKNRFGVPFSDTTLSNWMIKASEKLKPFKQRLKERLLENEYIQADETTLQVVNAHKGKATKKSYIWLGVGMDKYKVVYMHYANNRSAVAATALLNGFSGYLQTDGYAGYNDVVKTNDMTHLACWAHARRKFADIVKSGVSDPQSKRYAQEAIILIQKLYKIEREIKDDPPEQKLLIRKEKSQAIINTIREWINTKFYKAQELAGAIAKAFVYLNNQFAKLEVYLTDGRLNIDNNGAENHIRPMVLGRKNWLFATSVKGAEAIATWYTIIETAKANGLEPYHYLKYLMTEFPYYQRDGRDIEALLPWNVSDDGVVRIS